ncbi:MAG: M23 family metallopeptidase [FCB group bacterium]|nr:M23 family metallopeptidase [FCB group bacterium]
MLKKKLTLMLIPNSEGVLKQFSIYLALVYLSVAVLLILLISNFFLSANFFNNKVNTAELRRLRTENKKLKTQYEQMRWDLAEVQDRYQDLVQKEIKIRTMFDLPEINNEERQLGIGGPTSPNAAELSPTEEVAINTETKVDHLLRLSAFELEKYGEVEDALLKVKKRLDHTPSIWPTKGWVSRGFGMKYDPFTGYKQMHRGIDIANRTGTPVIATADGIVKQTGVSSGMGKFILLNHSYGFQTRFAHLSKIQVKQGQRIKRGDLIGLMGSTGYSTGPHLHYEVIRNGKFLNPAKFILNEMNK